MAPPQFSLRRVLICVSCCALSFGGLRYLFIPPPTAWPPDGNVYVIAVFAGAASFGMGIGVLFNKPFAPLAGAVLGFLAVFVVFAALVYSTYRNYWDIARPARNVQSNVGAQVE